MNRHTAAHSDFQNYLWGIFTLEQENLLDGKPVGFSGIISYGQYLGFLLGQNHQNERLV